MTHLDRLARLDRLDRLASGSVRPRRSRATLTLVAAWLCSVALVSAPSPATAAGSAPSPPSTAAPPCTTAVAPAAPLAGVPTFLVDGAVVPFGVAVAPDGRQAFVSDAAGSIDVLSVGPSGGVLERTDHFTAERAGRPVQAAPSLDFSPLGLVMAPGGRYLVAAEGTGAAVFDVRRLESVRAAPASWLVGTLRSPGSGAIEAAVAPDGRYVFVTLESSRAMAVFRLGSALRVGFGRSDLVGLVPLGVAPVGMAVAPGGRYLYVTSESEGLGRPEGTLSTVSLAAAEHRPSRSVVSTVPAGCSPVRVVAAGRYVYVTARGSDALLQYDAADLVAHPASALVGAVRVGEAPVGLAVVDGGTRVVVADSDRFHAPGNAASLAVVDVSGGRMTLRGYLSTGAFPRDMAVGDAGRWVLVTDYLSGEVEGVGAAALP